MKHVNLILSTVVIPDSTEQWELFLIIMFCFQASCRYLADCSEKLDGKLDTDLSFYLPGFFLSL